MILKKYFIILLIIFISRITDAQSFSLNQGGANTTNYYIELPYEFIKDKLIVDVEIDKIKRKFLFDTGAATIIYENLAREISLDTISFNLLTDSQGKQDSMSFSIINKIKIKGVTFENIPAFILPEDLFSECFGVDGIVGSNLLRNSIVQFDTKNKIIVITDNKKMLDLKRKYASKMMLNHQSNPYIKLVINDKAKEEVLFDSGADGFYDICIPHYNYFSVNKLFNDSLIGYGVNTGGFLGFASESKKVKLKINSLKIGKCILNDLWIETNLGNNSKVGTEIFNHGKVTLDYKHSKFYFEPFEKEQFVNEKQWPLAPIFKNGKLYVGVVWENCPEDIQLGDEIIEIDGVKTEYADFCDFLLNFSQEKKEKLELTLKDGNGTVKKVNVRKE